jgi:probable DNA repair protein
MEALAAARIDEWLLNGGLVVASSERAARACAAAFHRARRAEGLAAWPAPNILDWKSFVRAAWEERTQDGRLLLSPMQEQAIWTEIVGAEKHLATLLSGPRHRLASLAMEAHERLCLYAPELLRETARAAWQQDAGAFSGWLAAFDESCRAGNLLSPTRLPLELFSLLAAESTQRPPLLLAGFDRILPTQRRLLDAWGEWRLTALDAPAAETAFHIAPDVQTELAACALWCKRRLAANSNARILVVTQDAVARRGEIERAFLKLTGSARTPLFEFSLGVPLSQVALPKAAHLLLRWLSGPLAEHELDWLLSTGHATAGTQESSALQAAMRRIRQRSQEQPNWTIEELIGHSPDHALPTPWVQRMIEALRYLADLARRPQTPIEWAERVPHLLQTIGWPGGRPLSSAEFQAADRWNRALETCASLGFDGHRVSWQEFLSLLARTLDETLFAPESHDALIQIAGPAESAGLTADAVWFLGAAEDAWPPGGTTHPLVPLELQRKAGMPHATPQLDWDLAQAITNRLLASASEVLFSYATQNEGVETRPSRLVAQLAGPPQPLPPELVPPSPSTPLTVCFQDPDRIPLPPGKVEGGANVLTTQSQCPFKAFATARLGAQGWELAQPGLTPSQRGQLLHAVLHAVWAGPPDGIRSHDELLGLNEPSSFVAAHVRRVFQQQIRPGIRRRMSQRYLELENQRLARLVTEWLEYEAARIRFEVTETEVKRTIHLSGLTFDLRLDRIDRLNDGSLLVIDYKSGDVSPKSWDPPRPGDVQLPLYAGFALNREEDTLGGLVFAKVRPGNLEFAGRVGDAKSTLLPDISAGKALLKNPFTAEMLIAWKETIEHLAQDFLAGHAEVDPREYPKTCERCGLETLCRIRESRPPVESGDDADRAIGSEEAQDE